MWRELLLCTFSAKTLRRSQAQPCKPKPGAQSGGQGQNWAGQGAAGGWERRWEDSRPPPPFLSFLPARRLRKGPDGQQAKVPSSLVGRDLGQVSFEGVNTHRVPGGGSGPHLRGQCSSNGPGVGC